MINPHVKNNSILFSLLTHDERWAICGVPLAAYPKEAEQGIFPPKTSQGHEGQDNLCKSRTALRPLGIFVTVL